MKPLLLPRLGSLTLLAACYFLTGGDVRAGATRGWLNWRGPHQNGTSSETGLPDKVDVKTALWTADFPGASTPVVANGRLYIMGYLGDDGPE